MNIRQTDYSTTPLARARRPGDPATLAFAGVIDQALRASRQPLIRGLSESCFQKLLEEFFCGLSFANGERCAAPEEIHVVGIEISGHAINRGHRPQRADVIIRAPITHDTHGTDRQQHGKSLPDHVIETRLADFIEINRVGLAGCRAWPG